MPPTPRVLAAIAFLSFLLPASSQAPDCRIIESSGVHFRRSQHSEASLLGCLPPGALVANPRTCVSKGEVKVVSPTCRSAKQIAPENLIRGAEAMRGRRKHEGCPLQ